MTDDQNFLTSGESGSGDFADNSANAGSAQDTNADFSQLGRIKTATTTAGNTGNPRRKTDRNLVAAIGIAALLSSYSIVTLFWFQWGFVLLAALVLVMGAYEVTRAIRHSGASPQLVPILISILAITLCPWISKTVESSTEKSLAVMIGTFAVGAMLCLVWRLPKGAEGYIRDASSAIFVLGYLGLLGSTIILMMAEPKGAWRVVAFLLVNSLNDTGAYVLGSLTGKHKVAPKISPNKTWEGMFGGLFCALVAGVAVMMLIFHASWWAGLLLGAVVFVLGTSGDLIESMIKRDAGIKDMSSLLPGHGGFMDRIDSMLVAAPGAWLVLHLFVG